MHEMGIASKDSTARPLRILYAAGPGDIIRTYRHWAVGEYDPTQVSMTSSGMFYDECREIGAAAYVIGTHRRRETVCDGPFRIEHRPTPFESRGGLLYHLGQIWAGLRLVASAVWFRADVAVIVCGTTYWFVLWLLPLLGVRVISSLHCVLWAKYGEMIPTHRMINLLNRSFLRRGPFRILSMSDDITQQVIETTAGRNRPIRQFLPTYRAGQFAGIAPADPARRPFRVCFAGRMEPNKGVLDLLSIAKDFDARGIHDIEFDLCGAGSALEQVRREAAAAGISARFRCHGHCNWPTMREVYGSSHVVVVPTTSHFTEGFNQVVAEAVLAGRPVITSAVCPAIVYVKPAVVEVPVDDIAAYAEAILRLSREPDFYRAKVEGSLDVQQQFYDLQRSWKNVLHMALRDLQPMPAEPRQAETEGEPAVAR
jgi:glycosyltransferase involved in cell wall biosynthesis